MSTTTVTRDAILETSTGSLHGYSVTADAGQSYAVIGPAGPDVIYGVSRRTNLLVRVVRTGTANVRGKGEQVRVRIEFARDTGDAAGTLAFEPILSGGGVAPRVLFG